MSPLAVQFAVARLEKIGRPAGAGIVENAGSVESWVSQLPDTLKSACPCVVSIWFVAHEFSCGNPETIVDFFGEFDRLFHAPTLFLARSCAIPPNVLALNHDLSIMPEFLFFHELSHQGILDWDTWQGILRQIPYTLFLAESFRSCRRSKWRRNPKQFRVAFKTGVTPA